MDIEGDLDRIQRKAAAEHERRKQETQRKLAREKKIKEEAILAQNRVTEIAHQRREEQKILQQQREESIVKNGGISLNVYLVVKPLVKAHSNRVILPSSFLTSLQGRLDSVQGPLTFKLSYGAGYTYCGVEDFTAEEGEILIPPIVALSLVRGENLDSLSDQKIKVEYHQLDRFDNVNVQLRPLGEGFHREGVDMVKLDIKLLLLQALQNVLTISTGDFVMVRFEGQSYSLTIESMSPENAVILVDTDLEVDILPSETAQQKLDNDKSYLDFISQRQAKVRHIVIPEPVTTIPVATIRVRLPAGTQITRSFDPESNIQQLFHWVFSVLPDPPANALRSDFNFVLRRSDRSSVPFSNAETFKSLGLTKDSLMVDWKLEQLVRDISVSEKAEPAAFSVALQQAEEQSDLQDISKLESDTEPPIEPLEDVDKVTIFNNLVGQGITNTRAAQIAQKFSLQILELGKMGFENAPDYIDLLEKYQGRLERIVNVLAGAD